MVLPRLTLLEQRYAIGRVIESPESIAIYYQAWNLKTEDKVVIKEYFPPKLAHREEGNPQVVLGDVALADSFRYGREQYSKEAVVLSTITHPNLIREIESFEVHNTIYRVMEHHAGASLGSVLEQQGGKLAAETAVTIMIPVLDGLQAAHQRGLIHGGLSSEAIYLAKNKGPILRGFRTAQIMLSIRLQDTAELALDGFGAPEQYDAFGQQGPWTDVYGASALIYHMLTGQALPVATQRLEQDNIPDLLRGAGVIPEELCVVLELGLSLDSGDRPRSVQALQEMLVELSKNGGLEQPAGAAATVSLPGMEAPAVEMAAVPTTEPEPVVEEESIEEIEPTTGYQPVVESEPVAIADTAENLAETFESEEEPEEVAVEEPFEEIEASYEEPETYTFELEETEIETASIEEEEEAEFLETPEFTLSEDVEPQQLDDLAEEETGYISWSAPEEDTVSYPAVEEEAPVEEVEAPALEADVPASEPEAVQGSWYEPEVEQQEEDGADASYVAAEVALEADEADLLELDEINLDADPPVLEESQDQSAAESKEQPRLDRRRDRSPRRRASQGTKKPMVVLAGIAAVVLISITGVFAMRGGEEGGVNQFAYYRAQGDSLFALANYAEAKNQYEHALASQPNDTYITGRLSETETRLSEVSDERYEGYLNQGDEYFNQADSLMQANEPMLALSYYTEANKAYYEALKYRPDDPVALEKGQKTSDGLSDALAKSQSIAAAQAATAAEVAGENAAQQRYDNIRQVADALFANKAYAAAQEHYRKALAEKPRDTYAQDMIDQIDELITATAREDQFAQHLESGRTLCNEGRCEEAKAEFQRALSIKPGNQEVLDAIAEADRKIADAEKERDADEYQNLRSQGDNLMARGEYAEAIKRFEEALTLQPDDAYAKQKIQESQKAMDIAVAEENQPSLAEEGIYTIVETPPQLIDGLEGLHKKVRYPIGAARMKIQGRVYVQFVINEEGKVQDAEVIRGIGGGCDEEAVRVIEKARFVPGKIEGQPVKMRHTLFINFKLADQGSEDEEE